MAAADNALTRASLPEALVLIRAGGRSLDLGMVVDPAGLILTFERALSPRPETALAADTALQARTAGGETWDLRPVGAHRGLVLLRAQVAGNVAAQPIAAGGVTANQNLIAVFRGAEQGTRVTRPLADSGEFEFENAGAGRILLDERGAIVGTCASPPAQMAWHLRFLVDRARQGRTFRWPPALPSLANTLLRIGDERRRLHNDTAGAMSAYSEALRFDPASAPAHFRRGALLMTAGRHFSAQQEFTSALELEPDWDQALYARARATDHEGDFDTALAGYDAALAINPYYKNAFFWRARLHHRKNRFPQALADYSAALALAENDAMALAYRGLVYRETGQVEPARADFWQAARLAQEQNLPELLNLVNAQIRALPNPLAQPPKKQVGAGWQPVNEAQLPAHRSKVFLDTSSLMKPAAAEFFKRWLEQQLSTAGTIVLLSMDVMAELRRHQLGPIKEKHDLADAADRLLAPYLSEGRIRVLPKRSNAVTLADNSYLELLQRYCLNYDQTLVTNDRDLAFDALDILRRRSVRTTHSLTVLRIDNAGNPVDWAEVRKKRQVQRMPEVPRAPEPQRVPEAARAPEKPKLPPFVPLFALATGEAFADNRTLPLTLVCTTGDTVKNASGESIQLAQRIGGGGEGAAYMTADPARVCKIYGPAPPRVSMLKKLELMCSKKLAEPGVCWPDQLVFNARGEFAGYVMPRASGKPLQSSMMQPRLLLDLFPQWNRIQLVEAAIRILRGIASLNRNNILLGDINPNNILVHDEKTAFFVDTDSYQIGNFSCPVGLPPFVHPDLLGQDLRTRLRGPEHENFAVSTLAFMLVMPGKPPYSHQGGEGVVVNVLNGHFPYKRGKLAGKGVPRGPWGYIWSHFPEDLREQFHLVFTDGQQRTAADWVVQLHHYLRYLRAEKCPPESREIFPKGYRLLPKEVFLKKNGTWHKCAQCGAEFGRFPDEEAHHDLCLNCRMRPVQVPCKRCKNPVTLTLERYYDRAGKSFLCAVCQEGLKQRRQQPVN